MAIERDNPVFQTALKFIDAFAYAPNDPQRQQHPAKLIQAAFNPHEAKRQRFLAGLHLVNLGIPLEERVASKIMASQSLPFNCDDARLFAQGGEHAVFLLESEESRHVLKIDRHSIGMDQQGLAIRSQKVKQEYEKIKGWFSQTPNVIPEEHVLILQSHVFGMSAVGITQPYFPDGKDFFEDYTQEELVDLFRQKETLRRTYVDFANRLLNIQTNQHLTIDILGNKNLSLIGDDRLVFLDPHLVFNLDNDNLKKDERLMLGQRIDQIGEILKAVA